MVVEPAAASARPLPQSVPRQGGDVRDVDQMGPVGHQNSDPGDHRFWDPVFRIENLSIVVPDFDPHLRLD